MNAETSAWERRSMVRVVPPVMPRKLAKVPFVELADGRLQGVVSSGSDIERVYVSSFTTGTHAYSCSTNNNRPCGALPSGSSPCKHLHLLAAEAVLQYGIDRVARYLRVDIGDDASTGADLVDSMNGQVERAPAATVFSRFLRHLNYLEIPDTTTPIPEMHWFPALGAAR
ncbi:hypothetical protein ACQP25_02325 [Microtetraspora malaysiensis]|uniref:hypothetical protein n=1 Tax=Microtetraspora malaysiensis TaxID=161358 RepID=UPI003D92D491